MRRGIYQSALAKDFDADFGYPAIITQDDTLSAYRRMALARAAVNRTVGKVWSTNPWIQEAERDEGETRAETVLEAEIRKRFDRIGVWRSLQRVDTAALASGWSAALLRLADGKELSSPARGVRGGVNALVEVVPVWAGELTVKAWDEDPKSPDYGKPVLFERKEPALGSRKARTYQIHASRLLVWSEDGQPHGRSILEAGYNDLLDIKKVGGSGGEGFWRNAKSLPVLSVDKEIDLGAMADAQGLSVKDMFEKMDEKVRDSLTSFQRLLMMSGLKAEMLSISLPDPRPYFEQYASQFAASIQMPVKILLGSQTGERASTEDAAEWAQTCMQRRSNYVIPCIMGLLDKLVAAGILPERDWALDWQDLTAATKGQQLANAALMAQINSANMAVDPDPVFAVSEIRSEVGLEPKEYDETALEDALEAVGG